MTYSRPLLLRILGLAITINSGLTSATAQSCEQSVYRGFDSRLDTVLVGTLPKDVDHIVGFEIAKGRLFIADPHRILGLSKQEAVSIPVSEEITALAVDGTGAIVIGTNNAVERLNSDGTVTKDVALSSAIKGQMLNSGSNTFMDIQKGAKEVSFTARRPSGKSLSLANAPGELRAAVWNDAGLAAVVGNTLYYWSPGSSQLLSLANDVGLASATGVCVVGTQRIVIGTRSTMVLIDHGHASVLVAMQGICRFENGNIYLLDKQNGLLWAARGIEHIGVRKDDETFAVELLRKASAEDEKSPQFLEAARILGCQKAREFRRGHP